MREINTIDGITEEAICQRQADLPVRTRQPGTASQVIVRLANTGDSQVRREAEKDTKSVKQLPIHNQRSYIGQPRLG